MTFVRRARRGLTGITPIFVRPAISRGLLDLDTCTLATQYCDGLRGALVIYDPDDPHKHR